LTYNIFPFIIENKEVKMLKNNKMKPYIGLLVGVLIGGIGVSLIIPQIYENSKSITELNKTETSPLSKITTDVSNVRSISDDIKKGDIILDISDARVYVDNNIPNKYPEIKNMYYTSIDLIKWQMYSYPDLEGINNHSKDILISTFCIANSIEQKDVVHIYKILDLLVNWNYSYNEIFTNINNYLNSNFNIDVPNISEVKTLCSIFNQYPVKKFGFLYEGDLKNELKK
jgi:hypothetical protein